jgi:HEAT repeat protein
VSDRYDEALHAVTLDVKQQNFDGKPFCMPVVIEAYFGDDVARIEPMLYRNDQMVTIFNVTSAPDMVIFDPNSNILKQLTFPKSLEELTYQLADAHHIGDREWALQQLAALKDADGSTRAAIVALAQLARAQKEPQEALPILDRIISHDPLISTRIAAAKALGVLGDDVALPMLERVERTDSQLLVRDGAASAVAAIKALGSHYGERVLFETR